MIASNSETLLLGLIAACVSVLTIYLGTQEHRWLLRIAMAVRSMILVLLSAQWLTEGAGLIVHLRPVDEVRLLAGLFLSIGLVGVARIWYGFQGRVYAPRRHGVEV